MLSQKLGKAIYVIDFTPDDRHSIFVIPYTNPSM